MVKSVADSTKEVINGHTARVGRDGCSGEELNKGGKLGSLGVRTHAVLVFIQEWKVG